MTNPMEHPKEEFHNFPWDHLKTAVICMQSDLVKVADEIKDHPRRYWLHFLDAPCIVLGYTGHNETWYIPSSLASLLVERFESGKKAQLITIHKVLGIKTNE